MPEPIIPSGRDYDAGLAPGERKGAKRGILGRIAGKIRKGRRSKVYDFDLRLDPSVGARQSQPQERRPSSTLKDAPPSKPPEPAKPDKGTRAQQTESVPARPAKSLPFTRQSTPAPAPKSRSSRPQPPAPPSLESLIEAQVPGGSLGLTAWLLIANPDDCSTSAVEYLDHVASTCGDKLLATFIRWRLSAAAAGDGASSRSLTLEAAEAPDLPADIAKVLAFLAINPMSLAIYRGDVGLGEGKTAALAQLRSFCRDYPSVLPVLAALETGDVATALRAVNTGCAAWHYGMSTINAAVAAVGGVTSTVDLPICRIPRGWLEGSAAERCRAAALSSIFADDQRSQLRRHFEPGFSAAIASMPSDVHAAAEAWLSARGVRTVAATQPPLRRQLRAQTASSAPRVQQLRTDAVSYNRCRRCGVGEAPIGGICSLCARGGD